MVTDYVYYNVLIISNHVSLSEVYGLRVYKHTHVIVCPLSQSIIGIKEIIGAIYWGNIYRHRL